MRVDIDNAVIRNPHFQTALRLASEQLAVSANLIVAEGGPMVLAVDPANTGRNVILYTPTVTSHITYHKLFNISAGTGQLTIKAPDTATTLGVLDPGGSADLYYLNGAWNAYIDQGGVSARNNAYKTIIPIHMQLTALIATAIPAIAIPFNFTLTGVSFRSKNPPTTAAKAVTATPAINGVACTGGVISLTTAALTPGNTNLAGTAITALNTGTAGQVVSFALSAVTAFVEGDGQFELSVTQSASP